MIAGPGRCRQRQQPAEQAETTVEQPLPGAAGAGQRLSCGPLDRPQQQWLMLRMQPFEVTFERSDRQLMEDSMVLQFQQQIGEALLIVL
ncbi:hypothetical protein [endosymbiont of Tevnia jerichonana]|uniref:hypothetical protein n=1 Tax=endosymbiont of Tevnia jerichonana TaxID=94785 RepID=UPI0005938DCF|nr:hypothetical protein [endosymbiont of Tevnia jerichonana]